MSDRAETGEHGGHTIPGNGATTGSDAFRRSDTVEQFGEFAEMGLFDRERRIVEEYFSGEGTRVLDLGCGAGRTTRPLADAGFDVVGLDLSEPMISTARQQFEEGTFCVGDATGLPFPDDAFDHVLFSFNGIDYISPESSRYEALAEIRRVMCDDGTFVFSTHNSRFLLPAPLSDIVGYAQVVLFWMENLLDGRLRSRYKLDPAFDQTVTYCISPRDQRRQLRECGFELVDVHGMSDGPLRNLEPWLYYVARPDPGEADNK